MKTMAGHPVEVLNMICGYANSVAEEDVENPNAREAVAGSIVGFCLQVRNHALGKCEIDQDPTRESVQLDMAILKAWKEGREESRS